MKSVISFDLRPYQREMLAGRFAFDFLAPFNGVSRITSLEIDGEGDDECARIKGDDFNIRIEKCGIGIRMECESDDQSVLKSLEKMSGFIANTIYDISQRVENVDGPKM